MFRGWFAPDNGYQYSFVTRWIAGPIALLILGWTALSLPESINASRNDGIHGVFTSTRSDCGGRGGCTYYGDFVSNDGTVELDDVFIDGGVGKVGEIVDAQYFENSRFSDKVYELNSRDWIWVLLFLVPATLYFGWWCRAVVFRRSTGITKKR